MTASPDLLEQALAGDVRALGRCISVIEEGGPQGRRLVGRIYARTGRARVIGLTGPPGVGKSSLTDRLTARYRSQGLRVGIVAVDPTSPFTGGAILGDRVRMTGHFTDPGVFIRSMATRGHLGGLSAATADVVDLLDVAGHDVVLVETIGVGQEDIEVSRIAEVVLLVLTPGLGDEIQVMKSGIMEVGDIFVVNKADLAGADRAEASLHAVLAGAGEEEMRPIVRTVATTGEGVAELAAAIDASQARLGAKAREERALARARSRIGRIVQDALLGRVRSAIDAALGEEQVAAVARREADPYSAAERILARALASGAGAVAGGGATC